MTEIKANFDYFNRTHMSEKLSYHFIRILKPLLSEGYVTADDLDDYKLSKEDIITTVAIIKAGTTELTKCRFTGADRTTHRLNIVSNQPTK